MPVKPQQLQRLVPTLTRMVRRFAPHLRKQRHLIIGSTIAVLAEVVFRLLEPWPLKYVFDRVLRVKPKVGPIGVDWIDSLDKGHLMTVLAIAIVVITTLRALAAYANAVGFALIGNRVLTDVRTELYKHLQCLSLSYHTRARGGDLIVRVIGDIGMLKDVAVTAMLPLLANVLILIGMFSFMLWRDLELGLLSMATMPLFALSTFKNSRNDQRRGAPAAHARERDGGDGGRINGRDQDSAGVVAGGPVLRELLGEQQQEPARRRAGEQALRQARALGGRDDGDRHGASPVARRGAGRREPAHARRPDRLPAISPDRVPPRARFR
jgi:ABC-type multidrug transport system fused ATPase/permease subunit